MNTNEKINFDLSCPAPITERLRILLGHGSGGRLTAKLVEETILPAFKNPLLDPLDDAAIISPGAGRIAMTTDSYVVTPIFFPGGDIGELAVNGTVNDLAVTGARPIALSLAFILEEGFPIADFERVIASIKRAASAAGGVAIMSCREGLEFGGDFASDTAPLYDLVESVLSACPNVHAMRDPTRGGVAATLVEIASRQRLGIEIDEARVPIRDRCSWRMRNARARSAAHRQRRESDRLCAASRGRRCALLLFTSLCNALASTAATKATACFDPSRPSR
jgi:hydrogenase expression/formation protein HypE